LDDLEGQYCNRNCVGGSASSLATAGFFCLDISFCTCRSDGGWPAEALAAGSEFYVHTA